MRRPFVLLAVGGVGLLLALVAAGAFWIERPVRLTVAVSRADTDDIALLSAARDLLASGRHAARLRIVEAADASAASAALDGNLADLAVVRTDIALPTRGRTVVILHRDIAILAAPASGAVREIGDLAHRRIGIVRNGPGNDGLLATALAQYDVAADSVEIVPLGIEEVAPALAVHRVDAVMAVDVASGPTVTRMVRAVAEAGDGPPVLVPIAEADAIAQRSPGYDKSEVVTGAFGGSPPRPAEDYDTLSVSHRLVASVDADGSAVTDLTRFLLSERAALAARVPLARRIEAPSTDKGAALPVHAAAAAYIDDEEETFFDKYSDMIYLGAMFFGVLASAATALVGRLNAGKAATLDASVKRLIAMLALARAAPTETALDGLQAETDDLLATAVDCASSGGDERRVAVFGLAIDQVRGAIRDRRAALAGADRAVTRRASAMS